MNVYELINSQGKAKYSSYASWSVERTGSVHGKTNIEIRKASCVAEQEPMLLLLIPVVDSPQDELSSAVDSQESRAHSRSPQFLTRSLFSELYFSGWI